MPRKQKTYIQAPEDEAKGKGAIPTQELVEHSRAYGGAICSICRHHIDIVDDDDRSMSDIEDKMEGGGLSDMVEKTKKISRKSASKVKKAGKETGKYITSVDGLASDVVNYGIPAATSASLGAATTALTGNPALGAVASAVGSKLGTMAADKIANETAIQSRYEGGGVKPKRKARFEKGSEEAREHMKMLREKRQKK